MRLMDSDRPAFFPRFRRFGCATLLTLAATLTLSQTSLAQDSQLRQLLLNNAWCSFSYNPSSGVTRTTRAVFTGDGMLRVSSGAESYSSGPYGSVAGQSSSADLYRWRIENGSLMLSEDGMAWEPLPAELTYNNNGSPIIQTEDGKYSVCQ